MDRITLEGLKREYLKELLKTKKSEIQSPLGFIFNAENDKFLKEKLEEINKNIEEYFQKQIFLGYEESEIEIYYIESEESLFVLDIRCRNIITKDCEFMGKIRYFIENLTCSPSSLPKGKYMEVKMIILEKQLSQMRDVIKEKK